MLPQLLANSNRLAFYMLFMFALGLIGLFLLLKKRKALPTIVDKAAIKEVATNSGIWLFALLTAVVYSMGLVLGS